MRRFSIFNLLGIGILIVALHLGYSAVTEYIADVNSKDWTQTTAIVTDLESWERRITRKKRSDRYVTVYDITYAYDVDGVSYEGVISGTQNFRVYGEEVPIKYNPAAPAESTETLNPSLYDLIVPLIAAAFFAVMGYFLSGIWTLFHRRQAQNKPEPPEVYLEEQPEPEPQKAEGGFGHHLKRIVILVVFVAAMVGFVKFGLSLGEKKEPVTAQLVQTILESRGYTVLDATTQYSKSWKMDLENALVVQTQGVLFIFVETADTSTAKDVVDGLYSHSLNTLAGEIDLEYKYSGNNFVVHAMEQDGQYAMHIQVEDTAAYVVCSESEAASVMCILDEIAYFN